jgi:dienelactone hydrolase
MYIIYPGKNPCIFTRTGRELNSRQTNNSTMTDETDTTDTIVSIPVDTVELEGELVVPEEATGTVVFAHGSGSSRHSPRNNTVADVVRSEGLATLLFDLLTEEEDEHRENRFDIPLLTDRLRAVTNWVRSREEIQQSSVGYFGASTGAAAAIRAAATVDTNIDAIVSRGGRVDLAAEALPQVDAPTLLIVGGNDDAVLERNRDAYDELNCTKELKIIKEAGHLFEDPSELEEVAEIATNWFDTKLNSYSDG